MTAKSYESKVLAAAALYLSRTPVHARDSEGNQLWTRHQVTRAFLAGHAAVISEESPAPQSLPDDYDALDGPLQKAASGTDYLCFAVESVMFRGRRATIIDRDFPIGTPVTVARPLSPLHLPGARYLNRVDGKTYVFVSENAGIVTFKREGRDTLRYLGRSEFEKRFELIPPSPLHHVVGTEALVKQAIEAVWRCGLVIESSVRRGDGPNQYAEVVEALKLVKQARAALATAAEGSAE